MASGGFWWWCVSVTEHLHMAAGLVWLLCKGIAVYVVVYISQQPYCGWFFIREDCSWLKIEFLS